jgi:Tol biopolymer transport system component
VTGEPGSLGGFSFSPDQKQVAVARSDTATGTADIWLLDLTRGATSRFTFGPARNFSPLWSPDGERIVFASERDGRSNLYQKAANGAGKEELLVGSDEWKRPRDFSRDGRFLAYSSFHPKTKTDVWLLPLSGDRKPFPFLQTQFDELDPQFSPDRRWMANASDESGKYQVYVQPVPAGGGKRQISTAGGRPLK